MDVTESGHFCRQSGEVNPSPFEQRPSQSVIGLVFPDEERHAAVIQEPFQGAVPPYVEIRFQDTPRLAVHVIQYLSHVIAAGISPEKAVHAFHELPELVPVGKGGVKNELPVEVAGKGEQPVDIRVAPAHPTSGKLREVAVSFSGGRHVGKEDRLQFSFIGQVRPYRGVRELVHVSSGIGIFSAGGVNQRGQACRNGMHVILFDRSRFAVYPPVVVRQVPVELLQPFPARRPVTENKYAP